MEEMKYLLTKDNCKRVANQLDNENGMDEFASDFFGQYKNLWRKWSSEINTKDLFQRYLHHPMEKSIPLIEISKLFRKPTRDRLEVLFVNCNPSGTDITYYKKKNAIGDDFFYYDKPNNAYLKNAEAFYKELGLVDGNYAMIDLFPIVVKDQAILKNAYLTYTDFFDCLVKIFVDIVIELQPMVIVVTNAFVRDVLKKEMPKFFCFIENSLGVFYEMKNSRLDTAVFCGGMIAGRQQMDVDSKRRLIRDVRNYLWSIKVKTI